MFYIVSYWFRDSHNRVQEGDYYTTSLIDVYAWSDMVKFRGGRARCDLSLKVG